MKNTLFTLLAASFLILSGCTDTDDYAQETATPQATPILTEEESKLVEDYIKPQKNAEGKTVEGIDPLVQLLSN